MFSFGFLVTGASVSIPSDFCHHFMVLYPCMQQYVIFNVLKEYCISKEEEEGV
jgi:hypothetical protein